MNHRARIHRVPARFSWDRALCSARQHRPSRVPPPNDPWPVKSPRPPTCSGPRSSRVRAATETPAAARGKAEAQTQGLPRSPGGRIFPPLHPAPRRERRLWESLPPMRSGAKPQSPRSSSPGGLTRARPRSAAACPRRPAPRAVPPPAAAAPPRRRPGRVRTTTPFWRRWPWPAADGPAEEAPGPGVCSRDPR